MKLKGGCYAIFGVIASCVCSLQAHGMLVAVASNFSAPFEEINHAFKKAHPGVADVEPIYGSSAKLYAQIRQGAPFALFLSADDAKTEALEDNKLVVDGFRSPYALGRLALMTSKNSHFPAALSRVQTSKSLAMANPELAPYGRASREVFDALVTDKAASMPRIIYAENIAQAFHFAFTANVDAAFVAYAHIIDKHIETGDYILVPENLYHAIVQEAVVLKSENEEDAYTFFHFLMSEKARSIIENYGYHLPRSVSNDNYGLIRKIDD